MVPIDPAIESLQFVEYAKDHPEYLPLPARRDANGTVVTCWRLTWRERLYVLLGGKFYLTLLTFNRPLQPIRVSIEKPDVESA